MTLTVLTDTAPALQWEPPVLLDTGDVKLTNTGGFDIVRMVFSGAQDLFSLKTGSRPQISAYRAISSFRVLTYGQSQTARSLFRLM